jgi:hypothetical protein
VDHYWTASVWVGGITLAVTLLLLLVLFALKLAEQARLRADRRFDELWHPWLVRATLDDATLQANLPSLSAGDQWRFLKLWVRFQATVRGAAQERLRQLGLHLPCAQWARELLNSPHRSEQIFAILTLGYLKDEAMWSALEARLDDSRNSVFIYVAWALLQLSSARATPLVVAQLMRRRDLNLLQTSTVLKPFRQALHPPLTQGLALVAKSAHASADPWLLKLAYALGVQVENDVLLPLLQPDQPMDILIGALRLLQRPEGLGAVRALSNHPDWQVRTQVAITLSRLGQSDDLDRLLQLLMDPQWWVRYRAAQALAISPFHGRSALQARVAALPDRYAREMAQQVFLEMPASLP